MDLTEIIRSAAETVKRLGTSAQDCKSCARLPLCNAYSEGSGFRNCDYKWCHDDEAKEALEEMLKNAKKET
ncbi:hypothetical protein [Ruminococcus flavefaciens]|uniref:hypothetical protein n=1 Tax=Ruminococcus flavefaciens TaxID=1265 RepID=UPI0026E9E860|nr:hypothetical protein [Ruminococcus flavefaciens]